MRRAFVAVFLAGVAVLAVLAATSGSALVYTLGVQPQQAITSIGPGDTACQGPLLLPRDAEVERLGFHAAGGGPVEASVRDAEGRRTLRSGEATAAAAGTPPALVRADVEPLATQDPVAVCVTNRGEAPVELWGTIDAASGTSTATVNGEQTGMDMTVVLERREERSLLALAPDMADRASLFHARWQSPAAFAVLALLVLIAVPALLLVALRAALRP